MQKISAYLNNLLTDNKVGINGVAIVCIVIVVIAIVVIEEIVFIVRIRRTKPEPIVNYQFDRDTPNINQLIKLLYLLIVFYRSR